MSEERNKPEKKIKVGKISVTLWGKSITRKDGSVVELQRACIQHSHKRKDNNEWVNQQIWLNIDELRQVAEALDAIGEEQSSPSFKVNHLMGYIKANSLDAGLDVIGLAEMSVPEILREYGIRVKLKPWEEQMVKDELRELVEQREFAEMARMVHNGNLDLGSPAGLHTA